MTQFSQRGSSGTADHHVGETIEMFHFRRERLYDGGEPLAAVMISAIFASAWPVRWMNCNLVAARVPEGQRFHDQLIQPVRNPGFRP